MLSAAGDSNTLSAAGAYRKYFQLNKGCCESELLLPLRSVGIRVPEVKRLFPVGLTGGRSNPVCCLIDTNEREADWFEMESKKVLWG